MLRHSYAWSLAYCIVICLIGHRCRANPNDSAVQWCKTYRNPTRLSLRQALDVNHLVEHLNEQLNSTLTVAQLGTWLEHNRITAGQPTEADYLQFCTGIYTKAMETVGHPSRGEDHFIYNIFNIRPKVWIASLVSIFVISAVGLLGVGVVPLVQKVFYNQVIQYLVALAVGTLTGDAMLHLLPHAITGGHGHSHEEAEGGGEDKERIAVMKGLVALGGVYFFFMAEKLLGLVSEYRAEKKLEKEDRERALNNPRLSIEARRLSSVRPSLTPGSLTVPGQPRRLSQLDPSLCRRASRAMSIVNEDILTTGLTHKAMKTMDILYSYAEEDNALQEQVEREDKLLSVQNATHLSPPDPNQALKSGIIKKSDELQPSQSIPKITIVGDDDHDHKHESRDHGHSHEHETDKDKRESIKKDKIEVSEPDKAKPGHGHGHSHEVPASVAAVAWMVIMGDGLHNFTDGMAIGAAFAQSISGGLSTSVAVFCHELPHELGDFAVLLKTGMRIKEALFFNVVSSVLCLFGMLIGIALGNVESASYWIFAVTAGTFIYIALVDMLPELNSVELRPGQTRTGQLIIQVAGLMTGVGIMLTIALFEDKIRVFVD